ncbi:MAG: phosphoserine transaminase [Alphaproteobacteria bacterium]|nr:phosphoserine transaminase [Alphaproteobacteria bacterium]
MTSLKLPDNPKFSSGPCSKIPNWDSSFLNNAVLGRSHRAPICVKKIQELINETKLVLKIPKNYQVAIVGGSDTGAFEMAMWSLLGAKGINILSWDSFGRDWVTDVIDQLKIKDTKLIEAEYGYLPDINKVDFNNDVIFTWNATTAGVKVPNGDWIKDDREGLTLCDATSAVLAMDISWNKLDVTTFSWQKVLGGEAQHGILVLSPRAIQRLEEYTPTWPIPKLFRLTNKGKFQEKIFKGSTINTPSMLCIEDALNSLRWVKSIGGLDAMIKRSQSNLYIIEKWIDKTNWVEFLANDKNIRSSTSICLKIVDPWFLEKEVSEQKNILKSYFDLLEEKEAAYDINHYPSAPLGIRIWGGGTIELSNIKLLLPWLDWAWKNLPKV